MTARWPVIFALGWAGLLVVAPLLSLCAAALPLSLSPAEQGALLHSGARSVGLAVVVASAATGLATLLAWTVPPALLLVSLLLGRLVIALGVLALGVTPGASAAAVALVVDVTPFAAMIVLLRVRSRPRALLEAATDLGAGWLRRARLVEWPHLRPALLAAWVWALLQALGDVIAVELAGGGHCYTLGLLIRDALLREDAPGRALAAVVVLLGLSLGCAGLIARELDRAEQSEAGASASAPRWVRALGGVAWATLLVAPLALLLGPQPAGFDALDRRLFELLESTLGIAGAVAGLAGALGFAIAVATRGQRTRDVVVTAAMLAPLAIPPSVLGLLALDAASRVGWPPGVALTITTMLGPALALGFVTARVLISAIPAALIDAAADLGADAWARLRLVWWPLGAAALVAAVAVVLAWSLGQAAIPSFTSGPGGDTLAVALTIYARAGAMAVVRRWSWISLLSAVLCVGLIVLASRRAGGEGA